MVIIFTAYDERLLFSASNLSWLRAAIAMLAPILAHAIASASPIPEEAPVMMIFFPWSLSIKALSYFFHFMLHPTAGISV